MAALNFFFHGMRGVVICGNSLSLETRFGYRVHHPILGRGIEHLDAETCKQYMGIHPLPEKPKDGQLMLFDM